jgi:hypothetical protein
MMKTTRREFLTTATCTAAAFVARGRAFAQANSPFKLSVITGEISEDFDHACSVASKDFGMQWVELRTMWGKNIVDLAPKTSRAFNPSSPNTTCASPTSPARSSRSTGPARRVPNTVSNTITSRHTPNSRNRTTSSPPASILAKQLKTDKIRMLRFPAPRRSAPPIAPRSTKNFVQPARWQSSKGIILVIENEQSCNTRPPLKPRALWPPCRP